MATEREMTAEQALSRLGPGLEPLAREVRALIQRAAPGAAEMVDRETGALCYIYETQFCTMRGADGGIELTFDDGTLLPDPEGLLQGADERARSLSLRSAVELETPAVSALVEAAALRARDPSAGFCA